MITKKSKSVKKRKGRPVEYPASGKVIAFRIEYKKKLSSVAKFVLNSFRMKPIYYAIDDILYLFQLNPIERDNILAIIYSPILSLQNNFSIDFFKIWIDEIYINEISTVNKFLNKNSSNFEQFSYITIKFLYQTSVPSQKEDSLW